VLGGMIDANGAADAAVKAEKQAAEQTSDSEKPAHRLPRVDASASADADANANVKR
jgi:hypothetical protein